MQNLNNYHLFVQVVEKRSFTAAAKALGLPKSTLSKRIAELESMLGVRLLQRTSRSFGVTELGQIFYRNALTALHAANEAANSVKQHTGEPSGTLRFTCSIAMSQLAMVDILPGFMQAYPKVSVVQHATDNFVDIINEGFDVAIRAHTESLTDSSLIQRLIMPAPWSLVASPSYLERYGMPAEPSDLDSHACLVASHCPGGGPLSWKLMHSSGDMVVTHLQPRLRSDDMRMLKKAAEAGLGITALPSALCTSSIASGRLQCVLPDWRPGDATISALAPTRLGMLPAVRAFIDYLVEHFPGAFATDR